MPHRAASFARSKTRSAHTGDLDRAAVDKLAARIERDVDEGLLPAAQFALALDGEIVTEGVFGDAAIGRAHARR